MTSTAPPTPPPVATDVPLFLIADAAALTGVAPSQLRAWEHAGLLRPRRSAGAVRLFGPDDVARARLIKRSLVNPGRRGSVRRLCRQFADGALHPTPQDYAGLGDVDDRAGAGRAPTDTPTPAAGRSRARRATIRDVEPQTRGDVVDSMGDVVDSMAALVAVGDTRGRLTYTNPALRAILPPAGEAGARASSTEEFPLPTPLDALPLGEAALTGTPERDVVVLLPGSDGLERRTVWSIAPVRVGDGAVRGAVAVGRDATGERDAARSELLDARGDRRDRRDG